jgi:cytochrome c
MSNLNRTLNQYFSIIGRGQSMFLACGMIVMGFGQNISAQVACNDFATTDFKKTVLAQGLESPVKLAVTKDGRVFYTRRTGGVMLLKPGATTPVEALAIAVNDNANNEDGVLGIALDPKFESNSYIYVYHTLKSPMGYYLSRYTVVADKLTAGKTVLTIPHIFTVYGALIIHGAGAIAFDPAGNILIATGDLKITAGGFPVPVNENTTNFDAQATSANSNSLLGKILRITPKEDGTYSIPAGNLFPDGTPNTKPEIYAMGVRNPFTLTVDPLTGWAYSGEVGPDGVDGPIASQDEVNQIKQSGNFGWPYLSGDNQAYSDMGGKKYDAAALVNNSKNNTGVKTLPAGTKALFWFSNQGSWPITGIKPQGGSRCIKVGGFYRFNPSIANEKRLPPAMDNGFFMANHEEDNATLRFFKLGQDGSLASVKTVTTGLARPMAFEVGPDGALYIIEWGSDKGHWFNGANGPDGKVSKIEYTGTCSVTGIASKALLGKNEKPNLIALLAGSEILFPAWSNFVTAYGFDGKKKFTVLNRGSKTKSVVPPSHKSELLYLQFSRH